MKKVELKSIVGDLFTELDNGAFMTVKKGDKLNTMTIAWGTIGIFWSREVFIALVKEPRYTYELLKDNDEFTISVPLNGQLKDELITCGSQSGRDIDKFRECNLTPVYKELDTPLIDECDIHLECKVIYEDDLDKMYIPKKFYDIYYANEGVHKMFVGEVIGAYRK